MSALAGGRWEDVRALAASLVKPLDSESCPLSMAAGRVLAGDVRSTIDLPSADVSAMDGWAVAGPGPWRMSGRVVNGTGQPCALSFGEAVGIGTGGVVPAGTTAIVRREHGQVSGDVIAVGNGDLGMRDVRKQGEEVRRGEVVLPAGTRLDGISIAVAASLGLDELAAVRVPRVDLVVTGDEVILFGRPASGQVRDSVGPALAGMARGVGAQVADHVAVPDDVARLATQLSSSTADIIITTGGTASGDADHLREALGLVGAHIVVDRVAVRPGGPTVLAALPDGRLVAGLPGNPLAAVVGFMAVVEPALRAMTEQRMPPGVSEMLGTDLGTYDGTRVLPFSRVAGQAVPTSWRSSSMLRGLVESDGLIVIAPGSGRPGDAVESLAPVWRSS